MKHKILPATLVVVLFATLVIVLFGTFSVGRLKPRAARNPRTGRPVAIGGRVPRFKPSKELKQAVR